MADAPPIPCSAACRVLHEGKWYCHALHWALQAIFYNMGTRIDGLVFFVYFRWPIYIYTFIGCLGGLIYFAFLREKPRPTFGHSKPRSPRPNRRPTFCERRIRPLARHRHLLFAYMMSSVFMLVMHVIEPKWTPYIVGMAGKTPEHQQERISLFYVMLVLLSWWIEMLKLGEKPIGEVEEQSEGEEEERPVAKYKTPRRSPRKRK